VPGLDFHHDSSDCFAGVLVILRGEDLRKRLKDGDGWYMFLLRVFVAVKMSKKG